MYDIQDFKLINHYYRYDCSLISPIIPLKTTNISKLIN